MLPRFFAISQKIFEMSERCNISPRFSMKFLGRCNISRTFGFYNTLISRQKALKGVLSMSILQTIDLKKYYGTKPNITRALDGVNFSVNDGEFVAVVGTSGSGKSTLLHMMGGLDTPTSGTVIVRDKELSKMNDEQLTIFRRRNIGFIFQNYNLVPILMCMRTSSCRWNWTGTRWIRSFWTKSFTCWGWKIN